MNKLADAIIRADIFICFRIFRRPVWYIDSRWHINQYRQARAVVIGALAIYVLGCLAQATGPARWYFKAFYFGLGVTMILIYRELLRALAHASRDYERAPYQFTANQVRFHIIIFPPMRLMMLFVGAQIAAATMLIVALSPSVHEILWAVGQSWLLLIACAFYIAGMPHTPFARRPKKERAPALQPMPAPV